MDIVGFIIWLLIGAIAGWLAGQIMKGSGFGLIGNIVVGIVGAVIGGWLLGSLIPLAGYLGTIVYGTIGAVILLAIIGLFKKA
ncbi:GlsB/YeaQ/YmgE family stress response membrane protein [Oceanomicrobium pacificus]|uniref:GlsB/YeaQ/YmgE family stress response membrane protein n=1 Tax=Oceanomicrobium pacificus TaxID=2692916 RepID=A0A6B0U0K9_9RHOB|nr:GlsB/YeaQ/YmgE family stress response membrane protein [Oceanomicrobium pacificus]MXU66773.1 GlsB/YeaQ/YmgE family stress response membrane protein [Oceanomicrobium pacificus]